MAFLPNIQLTVLPEQAGDEARLKEQVAQKIHVAPSQVTTVRIVRKSIDARSRTQVKINLCVNVYTQGTQPEPITYPFHYQDVSKGKPVLIIGAGPAGLFAALRLIELGLKPIIIERGKEVSERKKDIAQLNRNNGLNLESNYCFGEGGAGTFSDGKLTSRTKSITLEKNFIFEEFIKAGAPEEIAYETYPHIGSDNLKKNNSGTHQKIQRARRRSHFRKRSHRNQ